MASMRERMKKRRDELNKRVKESIEDTGGFASILSLEKARKLSSNKEISTWKMKEGEHLIDLIPFFTGKSHPKLDEDIAAYTVTFYAHYNIGPNAEPIVCPAKTYKKKKLRCPICEFIAQNNLKEEDEELFEKIKVKRRSAYLVWVHDSEKEEDKGVQLLDIAYFFLEDKLKEIAVQPRQGGTINFADLDEGKTIIMKRTGSGKGTRVVGHRFDERPEPIPDYIAEQAFPLDECIIKPPEYKELYEIFHQGIKEPDEEVEYEEIESDNVEYEEYEEYEDAIEDEEEPEDEPEPEPEDEPEEEFEEEVEEEPEPEPEPEPRKRRVLKKKPENKEEKSEPKRRIRRRK